MLVVQVVSHWFLPLSFEPFYPVRIPVQHSSNLPTRKSAIGYPLVVLFELTI